VSALTLAAVLPMDRAYPSSACALPKQLHAEMLGGAMKTRSPCCALEVQHADILDCSGPCTAWLVTEASRDSKRLVRGAPQIFMEEFGSVRGHFGPINACAFSPDGRSFATGGEDGYIRMHHFDNDYLTARFF